VEKGTFLIAIPLVSVRTCYLMKQVFKRTFGCINYNSKEFGRLLNCITYVYKDRVL
jgi:hypothetical protein